MMLVIYGGQCDIETTQLIFIFFKAFIFLSLFYSHYICVVLNLFVWSLFLKRKFSFNLVIFVASFVFLKVK